jgi:hypothetical protein
MTLWVNRVIRATSSGVCFAPNRDQVGADNKLRSGPLADSCTAANSALLSRPPLMAGAQCVNADLARDAFDVDGLRLTLHCRQQVRGAG